MDREFYEKLKARFKRLGMDSKEIGAIVRKPEGTIRRYLNGFAPMPAEVEKKLVKFLENSDKNYSREYKK
jgi:hypothetical protein